MSKETTIYDQLLTTLGVLYDGKSRLINAYDLESNPDGLLRDGYGVKVDSAPAVDSEFCNFSKDRAFVIVLTREVITNGDVEPLDDVVKNMMEDIYTGQKDFMNPDQIGIEETIEKIDLGGISGVSYFVGDQKNFVSMEYTVNIQITEVI